MNKEVLDSFIGKEITYKGKKSKIKDIEENALSTLIFRLENGSLFGPIAFKSGLASTDDVELQKFIDDVNSEIENKRQSVKDAEAQKIKDRAEAQKTREKEVIQVKAEAKKDALIDFMNKEPEYFTLCKNAIIKGKGEDKLFRHKEYAMDYAQSYYDEYSKLKESRVASKGRFVSGTIEKTYPGDVTELLRWLKDALTNISVTIGKGTATSDTALIDEINAERGTNYRPSYSQNKQWSSWQAYLTDKETIDKMPKEVLEWKIEKNTGKTIDEVDTGPVYNKVENALSSNPVVLDLVLNYGFNLGRQK